ncbi:MAG: hypothetical protein E7568_01320 [Ruminococcaceae bacterium]|nr:hypothetical protein [Oscillospiraceae bacterium]
MKKFKFSLRDLFSNKRFTAAFSIIVAFIAWLAITVNETETRTSTFANITINVGIEDSFAGSAGLQVVSEDYLKTANVTVDGPNYIVSALKASDILVNADLSAVTAPGEYNIPLIAKAADGASGFTFVEVSPKYVKLKFDYVDTKDFEVIAKAENITAASGLIKDTPMLNYIGDSKKITISGARSNINLIERVEVIVKDKGEISASQTYDADLVIYDKDGKILDNALFELPEEALKVTVPIYKEKTVAVKPVFTGEPYAGAGAARVERLSISRITVQGAPDVIDTLEFVELKAIDYSLLASAKSFEVELNLPGGVKAANAVEKVKVTIKK